MLPAETASTSARWGQFTLIPAIKRATIDRNECVECYACYNGLSSERLNPVLVRTVRKLFQLVRLRFDPEPDICPTAAFEPEDLQWPRVVRRAFSDPRATHESTGVQGRGTEEVKTNDVTQRVKPRRSWVYHRIRQARGRRLVSRHSEDDTGVGDCERPFREK